MLAPNSEIDVIRSKYLEKQGYRVLRFWNNDVLKNFDGVLAAIHDELARGSENAPHPRPLPTASRGEGRDARSVKR